MLDISFIRENQKEISKAIKNKNVDLDLDVLLSTDDERKAIQMQGDVLRARKNELAKLLQDESARTPEVMKEGKQLKEDLSLIEDKESEVNTRFHELMLKVPNIYSDDTPVGKSDEENIEVFNSGEVTKFDFEIKDHITLGTELNILDLDRGVKVSGFRGYFLKNAGAQMHLAILQFVFDKLIARGFTPVIAPAIVREDSLVAMGQFPAHKAETYEIVSAESKDKKYLAGTAEVGLLGMYANEVLDKKSLPIKMVGFSPCYRSEAGSYSKDTRGLYRIHEFMKVEQIVLAENNIESSLAILEELRAISEEILTDLKLPYRVLSICTGDMGLGKYKMYDLETWMPSRNKYGETHSDSFLTDWQARRAGITYKDEGKSLFVHTLNNTAIASPRVLIAVWENYQQKDGSIKVPEVLVPYMRGLTVIK